MNITIKYTNLTGTPAIDSYINTKIGSVSKFMKKWEVKQELLAEVEIARTTRHHHKGDVYYAEVNIAVPGKMLRATHNDVDIRVAIDQVKDMLQREIRKYGTKLSDKTSKKKAAVRKARGK